MQFEFIQQDHVDNLNPFDLKQVFVSVVTSGLINYITQKVFSLLCQRPNTFSPSPRGPTIQTQSQEIPLFTKDAVIPTRTLQLSPGVAGHF